MSCVFDNSRVCDNSIQLRTTKLNSPDLSLLVPSEKQTEFKQAVKQEYYRTHYNLVYCQAVSGVQWAFVVSTCRVCLTALCLCCPGKCI